MSSANQGTLWTVSAYICAAGTLHSYTPRNSGIENSSQVVLAVKVLVNLFISSHNISRKDRFLKYWLPNISFLWRPYCCVYCVCKFSGRENEACRDVSKGFRQSLPFTKKGNEFHCKSLSPYCWDAISGTCLRGENNPCAPNWSLRATFPRYAAHTSSNRRTAFDKCRDHFAEPKMPPRKHNGCHVRWPARTTPPKLSKTFLLFDAF